MLIPSVHIVGIWPRAQTGQWAGWVFNLSYVAILTSFLCSLQCCSAPRERGILLGSFSKRGNIGTEQRLCSLPAQQKTLCPFCPKTLTSSCNSTHIQDWQNLSIYLVTVPACNWECAQFTDSFAVIP